MANLPELNEFTEGVYQLETSDPVLGGADGMTNVPIKALVNRTRWLKAQVDALAEAVEGAIDEAYVQAELAKLQFKAPVRVATTTNITLSALQTIDGVSLLVGERVLVKNQSAASQNGIYVVQTSAWIRAADMDADAEVRPGMAVVVSGGTLQGDTIWILSTDGTITVGTSAMAFRNLTDGFARLDLVTSLDDANVKLTGDQTIAGAKTFSGVVAHTGVGPSTGFTLANVHGAPGRFYGTTGDGADPTTANVRISSWYGIGFSPSTSGQAVPYGENAVWIDVRNGHMGTRGNITTNGDRFYHDSLGLPFQMGPGSGTGDANIYGHFVGAGKTLGWFTNGGAGAMSLDGVGNFSASGNISANGNIQPLGQFIGNGAGITNLSSAAVLNATAGASVGAVGTYAFLARRPASATSPGDTVAGSNLRYSDGGGNAGGTPSGTWLAMGMTINSTSDGGSTLWLRIS
jgi:phage-related tail fiber protein